MCSTTGREVSSAEIAASRVWIENWKRMLPCLVAARGLLPQTITSGIERYTAVRAADLASTPGKLAATEVKVREAHVDDYVLAVVRYELATNRPRHAAVAGVN